MDSSCEITILAIVRSSPLLIVVKSSVHENKFWLLIYWYSRLVIASCKKSWVLKIDWSHSLDERKWRCCQCVKEGSCTFSSCMMKVKCEEDNHEWGYAFATNGSVAKRRTGGNVHVRDQLELQHASLNINYADSRKFSEADRFPELAEQLNIFIVESLWNKFCFEKCIQWKFSKLQNVSKKYTLYKRWWTLLTVKILKKLSALVKA